MKETLTAIGLVLAATAFFAVGFLVTASPRDAGTFLRSPGAFFGYLCIILIVVSFFAVPCWLMYVHVTRPKLRAARGLCRMCGYSLIGNRSGVCPECGTPVAR
jgi:hypothetical protein